MKSLHRAGAAAALTLLNACASTGGVPTMQTIRSSVPGQREAGPAMPAETFAYAAATDGTLRVTVNSVVAAGQTGFIPHDRNWLQVHMTVANTSGRAVDFKETKAKLADGSALASASSPSELAKPPSVAKSLAFSGGAATAGMIVGTLLFPPAAIIGGAVAGFGPLMNVNRLQGTYAKLQQEGMRAGTIAPSTSSSGLVFIPAVAGQTGLIIFYEAGGETRTLEVQRIGR